MVKNVIDKNHNDTDIRYKNSKAPVISYVEAARSFHFLMPTVMKICWNVQTIFHRKIQKLKLTLQSDTHQTPASNISSLENLFQLLNLKS